MTTFNKKPFNEQPLNPSDISMMESGCFNLRPLNTLIVDGPLAAFGSVTLDAEIICYVEQMVGVISPQEIILQLEQDVQLLISCDVENIVEIEQNVRFEEAATIVAYIEQRVINTTTDKFLARNGWNMDITIAGIEIPHQFITTNPTITLEEDQSNLCEFTLLPSDPINLIDTTWGKSVTIDYYTETQSFRLFTGVIDIPEIDLIEKKVKFKCSNRREELINNNLSGVIPTIGRFSKEVFGKVNDTAEELEHRMKTVAASADFDTENVFHVNSWYAKPIADYTFSAADIYYRQPNLTWQSRSKIVNNINISLDYQYTRLYHYQRNWHWRAPFADDLCEFMLKQYSLLNIQMVTDAIDQAGWRVTGNIVFESLWSPGVCAYNGVTVLIWQSAFSLGNFKTTFDEHGNVLNDPSGLNIYHFEPFTKQTDLSAIYTLAADWSANTRFSQYVKEIYPITVKATQSISQFGAVVKNSDVSISQDYDASAWEDYLYETSTPTNAVSDGSSYYFNQDTNQFDLLNAQRTLIDEAKTSILEVHRDTLLQVEMYIKPYLQLSHTVKYDSNRITAKGKISRIIHVLDVMNGKDSTTTVDMSIFRSQGTATTTPTTNLPRTYDTISLPSQPIALPSQYGVEPTDATVGYVGNINNPMAAVGSLIRTDIQEEFRVDTPTIVDSMRKLRELNSSEAVFNIEIPNDLLEVDFND